MIETAKQILRSSQITSAGGNHGTWRSPGQFMRPEYLGKMFHKKLIRAQGMEHSLPESAVPSLTTLGPRIDRFIKAWDESGIKLRSLVQAVPAETRPAFELQVLLNRLTLDAQLISHVGEAAGSSVRRLQQMGS